MRKLIYIILLFVFANAQNLHFILPDNLGKEIKSTEKKEINQTFSELKNKNTELYTKDQNETNLSENNLTYSDENNKTESNTTNPLLPETITEDFNASYVSINAKSNIAIVINKKRFFKYIPSLMNAVNAYYAQKGIDYSIRLYNIDKNISSIPSKYIFYYTTNPKDLEKLKDYNKTFFFPLLSKNDTNITYKNFYFGSIDFKQQVKKLSTYIDDKTDIITSDTLIAKKLTSYEKNLTAEIENIYYYPYINYENLNNKYLFFNTKATKTAQVLSKITQKEINTKLILTPQIGYNPLMIVLTQPADIQKLIIANSIIRVPEIVSEYINLLNSDIKYNWVNYATCVLANKAYNLQNNGDEFYMSDFNTYIFNNQIDYQTKIYRIINGSFRQVE